jgi:conjugative transfer protein TraD
MRHKAHQHLETQLQRLEQKRHAAKQKLRALARQTRQEQRSRHGELVELAALGHVDPGTLLGGLCELATLLTDPERVARWKVLGDARLEACRRRKAHRRRLESSGDGGTCAERIETVQA